MTLIESAIALARDGWAVFPVKGKVPTTPHGFQDAESDPDKVKALFLKYPGDGVGGATGKVSGRWALDIDVKPDKLGVPAGGDESLRTLESANGALPETVQSLTRSGGTHYIFKYEPGLACSASVIGRGIDVRADGGYIVLPPSKGYAWEAAHHPDEVPVVAAPKWLLNLTKKKKEPLSSDDKITKDRNVTLTKIAGSFRRNGLDPESLYSALCTINAARCLPPLDDAEVRKIAESVGKKPVILPQGAYTDLWAAKLFKSKFGEDLHWSEQLGGWVIWDAARWVPDETFEILRMADQVTADMHTQANQTDDKKIKAFAIQREKITQKEAMVKTLRGLSGIAVRSNIFDQDVHLLNCPNGTFNLSTGELYDHKREDLITRRMDVVYNPDATCPRWERFMMEIFDGDSSLVEYVQRAVGYSLSGDITEQVMFVLYGTGKNGKSTFINTISAILGDYALNARPTLLIEKKYDTGANASGDIARLRGARFVSVLESNRNSAFDEAQVKALTGSDEITARFLYQEEFQFRPTHKIWFSTNHRPEITGTDDGIWRRVPTVPFKHFFSEAEADKDLEKKLAMELEGILNWAIEGYNKWHKWGLGKNPAVEEATESFKEDSDVLRDFIEERCVMDEGSTCSVQEVKEAFTDWRKSTGARFFRPAEIKTYFERKLGLKKRKISNEGGLWIWDGIRLNKVGINIGMGEKSGFFDDQRPY